MGDLYYGGLLGFVELDLCERNPYCLNNLVYTEAHWTVIRTNPRIVIKENVPL
jgi:hypothetical protein